MKKKQDELRQTILITEASKDDLFTEIADFKVKMAVLKGSNIAFASEADKLKIDLSEANKTIKIKDDMVRLTKD